ncbi:MAG: MarR family transcriptional regulator [Desulfuromonas sp.]|uniref:MarR family winged helix-turn-helix transcriptional regulator n=1 Tax=Desulfuromonas sp. TaxID=892 RepID=UPI000CBA7ACC|nr:MarR family transcriptional regulator [Desulfuromonas sp.]PLX85453.1 MAG: MarR family transcriptional regulator [Desulfuromonas sp.]
MPEKPKRQASPTSTENADRNDKTPAGYSSSEPGATPAVPKGSYELRILQSLRRIIRAVEIHSRKLATQHQITGPQLACLLALAENESLTTTGLAQAVYLSPSTVVGIIDRLADKGLVDRMRSTRDRRQVLICVTEAGKKLAENAPSPLQDTLSEALVKLPELEQVSITLAMEKVVDLMEARQIDAAPLLETGPISAGPAKKPPTDR